MKDPNPLVPQGSFEAHARGKSQVRLAVFTILTIHVVVLGALLIHGAGCKREENKDAAGATNDVATTPPFSSPSDAVTPATSGVPPIAEHPPASNIPPASGVFPPTNTGAGTQLPPPPVLPITPPPSVPQVPADTGAPGTEHTIVKGDTLAGLSTRYKVSVKAIQAANPGIDPAKLKVGQKVKIPAKSASVPSPSSPNASSDGNGTYVVKSGDTLGKIATAHGTTVKAVQKMNNLVTTQIRVGQKLKMPSRSTTAAKATPNPATPGGTPPTDLVVPPPVPPAPAQ
jgi:LysM repeat protein